MFGDASPVRLQKSFGRKKHHAFDIFISKPSRSTQKTSICWFFNPEALETLYQTTLSIYKKITGRVK
jgi:hypothetical protein